MLRARWPGQSPLRHPSHWAPIFSARGGLTGLTRGILASLGSEMPRAEWRGPFRMRHLRNAPATPTSSAEDDEGYEHGTERCPRNVVVPPSWRDLVRSLLPLACSAFLATRPTCNIDKALFGCDGAPYGHPSIGVTECRAAGARSRCPHNVEQLCLEPKRARSSRARGSICIYLMAFGPSRHRA